ncbi:mannosyltransferase family protein [Wenjunlia tyrosinilytica]|uniref:Membrane protein n=1 Tax=Wenjunlia tyrosinilytica TaxID=1544741 RepID=A0A918DTG4_9ACTN|nr:mannosyltransferase family protein [Wenjunlia tyrosinilytica]GGO81988.1 membrane protein [Wenjunlia tyrosinilytica]
MSTAKEDVAHEPLPAAAADSAERSVPRPRSDGGRPPWIRLVRHALAAPLIVYTVTAVLQLVVLHLMIAPGDEGVRGKLLSWDGHWYVDVAHHGYPQGFEYNEDGSLKGSTLAFFPLYPALVRLAHGVTGLGYETAALTVSRLAGAAAAVAVFHLVLRLHGRRAALAATLLVCVQPMAVSMSMAYTEGLFLALAAAALLAARREAWLTAGACGLLAGLTRSTAVAVSAALLVAAGWAMWQRRAVIRRALAGCALGSAGVPLYLLWVAGRTGRLDGWTAIQEAGWNTHWDWGTGTLRFLGDTFQRSDGWVAVSTALLLIATAVGCVVAAMERTWPPLVVYGVLVFVLTVGQTNYYHSKPRLLVPALVALVPLAVALARARTRTAVLVGSALALFGTWHGAYMLTVWHYAI